MMDGPAMDPDILDEKKQKNCRKNFFDGNPNER